MDQTGPGHPQSSAEKEGHPADEKMPRVGHSTALKEVVNGDGLLRDHGELDEDAIPTQVQRLNGSASCEETDSRISIPEGHVTVIKQADAQSHRATDDGGREYTVGADEGVPSLVRDDRLTIETLVLETDTTRSSSDASTAGNDSRLVEEVALDASDTFSTAQGDPLEPKTRTEEVVKDVIRGDEEEEKNKEADVVADTSKSTEGVKTVTLDSAEIIGEEKSSEKLDYVNGSLSELADGVECPTDEKVPEAQKLESEDEISKQKQETTPDVSKPDIPAKTVDDHTEIIEKKEEGDETVEHALEATELERADNKSRDNKEYETAVTPTIDDIDQFKPELIENEEPASLEQIILEESAEHLEVVLSDKIDVGQSLPLAEIEDKVDSLSRSKEQLDQQPLLESKETEQDSKEEETHIPEDRQAEDGKDLLQIDHPSEDQLGEGDSVGSVTSDKESKEPLSEGQDFPKKEEVTEPVPSESEDLDQHSDTVPLKPDEMSLKSEIGETLTQDEREKEETQVEDEKEEVDNFERISVDDKLDDGKKEDKFEDLDACHELDTEEGVKSELDTESLSVEKLPLSKDVFEESKIVQEKEAPLLTEADVSGDSNKFVTNESLVDKLSEKDEICAKEQEESDKEKGIEEESEEKEMDLSKEKHLVEETSSEPHLNELKDVMEGDTTNLMLAGDKVVDEKEYQTDDSKYSEEKRIDLVPNEEHIKDTKTEQEENNIEDEEVSIEFKKCVMQSELSERKVEQQEDIQEEIDNKEAKEVECDDEREKEVQEEKSEETVLVKDHEKASEEKKIESDNVQEKDVIENQIEFEKDEQECTEEKDKVCKEEEHEYVDKNKITEEEDLEEHIGEGDTKELKEEDHENISEIEAVTESVDEVITDDDKKKDSEIKKDEDKEILEQSTEAISVKKMEDVQKQAEDITDLSTKEIIDEHLDVAMESEKEEEAKGLEKDIKELDSKDGDAMQVADNEKLDDLEKEIDKETFDMTDGMEKPESEDEKETGDEKIDEKEENEDEVIEKVEKADESVEEKDDIVDVTETEEIIEKLTKTDESVDEKNDIVDIDESEEIIEKITKADEFVEEKDNIVDVEEPQEEKVQEMEKDVQEEETKEESIKLSDEEKEKEVTECKQTEELDETISIEESPEAVPVKTDEIEKEEKGSEEAGEKEEEEKDEERSETHEEKGENIEKEEQVDIKEGVINGELESPEIITKEPVKEYIAEVEVPKLEEEKVEEIKEEPKEEKPEGTKEVTVKTTKRSKEKKPKRDDLPKSPSKRRAGRTPPRSLYKKDGTHAGDSTKQVRTPTSPKKPLTSTKTTPSPKKTPPARNGMTSPARTPSSEGKKLPPIKAPVGQAPNPNLKNIKSKIGSLDNIKHKPGGGERKVSSQKLEWAASSKIGSLEKATHKPGGGDKRIQVQKVDFKDKAQSKVGSRDNIKHTPGGGAGKTQHVQDQSADNCIDSYKTDFKQKAAPKVGSLDNVKHAPGGGAVKIRSDKLNFKEKATSKVGSLSGSERGSTHGSDTQSPIPPSSPVGDEEAGTSMPPVAENGEENGISPVDGRADEEATPETPEAPGETMGSPQTAQC